MPTLSELEYQQLLSKAQIGELVEPIYNNPRLSNQAKALLKEQYPNLEIKDYDLEQTFNKKFDEIKKERDQERANALKEQQTRLANEKRAKVQSDYGFTEDGMKDLEKFMEEKEVWDYEVAATYHAAKNPKTSEAAYSDGMWNHQKQAGFAEMSQDPEGYARNQFIAAARRDEERMKSGRF